MAHSVSSMTVFPVLVPSIPYCVLPISSACFPQPPLLYRPLTAMCSLCAAFCLLALSLRPSRPVTLRMLPLGCLLRNPSVQNRVLIEHHFPGPSWLGLLHRLGIDEGSEGRTRFIRPHGSLFGQDGCSCLAEGPLCEVRAVRAGGATGSTTCIVAFGKLGATVSTTCIVFGKLGAQGSTCIVFGKLAAQGSTGIVFGKLRAQGSTTDVGNEVGQGMGAERQGGLQQVLLQAEQVPPGPGCRVEKDSERGRRDRGQGVHRAHHVGPGRHEEGLFVSED
eukprot:15438460-Alexandrium_andersonii.AAC.1